MLVILVLAGCVAPAPVATLPSGFVPLFDGKTAKGWHWSRTTHHGTTARAVIEELRPRLRERASGKVPVTPFNPPRL